MSGWLFLTPPPKQTRNPQMERSFASLVPIASYTLFYSHSRFFQHSLFFSLSLSLSFAFSMFYSLSVLPFVQFLFSLCIFYCLTVYIHLV